MVIKTADRIKELREQRGINQAELAKHFDVTRSSVNAWEMGISYPQLDKLVELAQFFHVTTDYLIGLEDGQRIDISEYSYDEQELIQRLLMYIDSNYPDNNK